MSQGIQIIRNYFQLKSNRENNIIKYIFFIRATAGHEDPFELDSSLLLSSGRHGEVVRGSITTILRHRYL